MKKSNPLVSLEKRYLQDTLVKEVERVLKSRSRNGALENECDFIAGAMAVMRTINVELFNSSEDMSMDIIPAIWMIIPISGRSLLDELK